MNSSRRREILLLCVVAAITALGMALVSAALGDSPLRATRGFILIAVLLIVTFLMDLVGRERDHSLLPIVALICGIGLVILWRLDPFRASKQILWMALGCVMMLATYMAVRDVRSLSRYKYAAGVGAILLLATTMIWGQTQFGARLWLEIAGVSVQPGEFAKLLMAIFLAGYMAERGQIIRDAPRNRFGLPMVELRYLGPVILVVLFCLLLFVTERDLGAAVLFLGLAIAVLYVGTGRRTYVMLGVVCFAVGTLVAAQTFPHVERRMVGWLDPWSDAADAGMQSLSVMYALAEGGTLGTGLGLGMPYKMPAVETDLIFAAVGEELGLAGTCALLLLFAMVLFKGFDIAWRSRDRFGLLLAAGLTSVLGLQAIVIVGGVTRALPLTGVTLPFVSYGGTSIIANFIAVGLLLAISRDCVYGPTVSVLAGQGAAGRGRDA
jgi:cell division protein FtsW (lipid II flippase)